jgi:outer membrane autotransporter protein
MALPTVGLEQIRDLHKVVSTKVGSIKYSCKGCAENPLNSAWVDMGQRKADIEAPVDVEAKINAVDLGFDVQSDPYNRLGVFASYRQGDYELSGEGQDYYSKTASEYNIDSWALGLYHRYDRRHLWTMASVFGGLQQVDLTTDDGVSADTDGLMFGANIEAGMVFEPKRRLTLEPSIRLGYNFIKYDDMSDRYGKTAEYDNISNLEAELGVKIEKSWIFGRRGIAKLFVKPSVIQNMGKGDVNITSIDAVEGIDNQTLLRGEIGMSIAGDNGLSGFATVGHTFGSDYKSTDFNAGLGYSW